MYGVQKRLNSDTGHVDLQKRTADCACVAAQSAYAQNSTIFLKQSSATTKLPNTQIRLCVLKVCQIIKYASAYLHTYYNLSDQM